MKKLSNRAIKNVDLIFKFLNPEMAKFKINTIVIIGMFFSMAKDLSLLNPNGRKCLDVVNDFLEEQKECFKKQRKKKRARRKA
jgi:hypothetical protein